MSDLTTLQELLSEDSADLEAERLILDVTETLLEMMERDEVSQKELAERLGKSKGHVSQLLNGERNMTLRTLSEVAYALGGRMTMSTGPLSADTESPWDRRSGAKIIEIKNYLREHPARSSGHSMLTREMSLEDLHTPESAGTGFETEMEPAVAS